MQKRQELVLEQYKELVAKISQDAKERKWTGKQVDLTAPGREGAKGETTEVLAEIAGTGK